MRLLNTTTSPPTLTEFGDAERPKYAILSHRWSNDECSYQEFLEGKRKDSLGYKKIRDFCNFAKSRQPSYEWVWVDTCCIDKTSSSELTESLNSMYRWYEEADVCYVYLADLPSKDCETNGGKKDRSDKFRRSDWFHRGWTLQELLAPSKVIFCDCDWEIYDSKAQLAEGIEDITGIAEPFLDGTHKPQQASVAMRMSWASKRQTTKLEDLSYCLLGLFDVNMPLLYGEGPKAFMRLQRKIIKASDDESIFAWTSSKLKNWGMLAPSPKEFQDAGRVVNVQLAPEERMPYYMTNKGLRLQTACDTYAWKEPGPSTGEVMGYPYRFVELGCFEASTAGMISEDTGAEEMWEDGALTIELDRIGPTWMRVNCESLGCVPRRARRKRQNGTYFGRGVQRVYFVDQPNPPA